MKGTTIKIEGDLLAGIEAAKDSTQSVSAYVRSVLRRDLDRRKLRDAATRYRDFVTSNANERSWLEEWDRADLISPPARPEHHE